MGSDNTDLLLHVRDPAHQLAGDGSAWVQDMGVYARRLDLKEVGVVTTIYRGWADYGSDETNPLWRIQKIVLDETSGLTLTDGMAGDGDFNEIWTDREGLSYS